MAKWKLNRALRITTIQGWRQLRPITAIFLEITLIKNLWRTDFVVVKTRHKKDKRMVNCSKLVYPTFSCSSCFLKCLAELLVFVSVISCVIILNVSWKTLSHSLFTIHISNAATLVKMKICVFFYLSWNKQLQFLYSKEHRRWLFTVSHHHQHQFSTLADCYHVFWVQSGRWQQQMQMQQPHSTRKTGCTCHSGCLKLMLFKQTKLQ